MKISELIGHYRRKAGMNQAELAKELGLKHRESICNTEKGRSFPEIKTLMNIAKILEIPDKEFVEALKETFLGKQTKDTRKKDGKE